MKFDSTREKKRTGGRGNCPSGRGGSPLKEKQGGKATLQRKGSFILPGRHSKGRASEKKIQGWLNGMAQSPPARIQKL